MTGTSSLPKYFRIFFICSAAFCGFWGEGVHAAAVMKPTSILAGHKAIYNIQFRSAKIGSQVVDVHGKLLYIFKPSCGGWISDHRFNLTYEYTDNPPLAVETKYATFESFEGDKLQFSSVRRSDGEIDQEIRGSAFLDVQKQAGGVATYTMPDKQSFKLSSDMLFPVSHTIKLIGEAQKGQHMLYAKLFDGSDTEGPIAVNAVIGAKKPSVIEKTISENIDKDLLNVPSWTVSMGFFPLQGDQSASDYELSMDLLENGIIRTMNVDYHDFSVTQKLVALEKVKPDECGE